MVDFLAPTSGIIVHICGKYGYDLPEKYRLFKENFPDTRNALLFANFILFIFFSFILFILFYFILFFSLVFLALSPSLSLNEQDVPHGALILVSKAEKKSILSHLGNNSLCLHPLSFGKLTLCYHKREQS